MTIEEFNKIPFRIVSHISQESVHITNYVSEDGLFIVSRITSKHGDEFGRTRVHYRIGDKWYKSKKKFLEALEKVEGNEKD